MINTKDWDNYFSDQDIATIKSFYSLMNSYYGNVGIYTKRDPFESNIALSLVRMLNAYDVYTSEHSVDVANISLEIAKRVDLDQDKLFEIYWAGIIHDIGKMGIDTKIINKPGRLTDAEYEEIKKHPVIAFDILKENKGLHNIAKYVKHHHERYDGKGYPDQLKGDEIPFEAQILAVADAVSSMATDRPYANKKTVEEIKEELRKYSGTQFNPDLADIMIQVIEEGYLNRRY